MESDNIVHYGTQHTFRRASLEIPKCWASSETLRDALQIVGSLLRGVVVMRHTDIRTTMNIYGDVVTDEMSTASLKVADLAFRGNRAQTEREPR